MKLYRIEWDIDDYFGSFEELIDAYIGAKIEPCIPHRTMIGENRTIPRICLSNSILGCVNGIGVGSLLNDIEGNMPVRKVPYIAIALFEFDIDEHDKQLITPNQLVSKDLVPDALKNNEYWYTGIAPISNVKGYYLGKECMQYKQDPELCVIQKIPAIATAVRLLEPNNKKVQGYRWTVSFNDTVF